MKAKQMLYKVSFRSYFLASTHDLGKNTTAFIWVLAENPVMALNVAVKKAAKEYKPETTEYTVTPEGEPAQEEK